jgi:predicted nucleic acid-binding protein
MSDFPKVLCNSGPLMALGKLNWLDLLADLYQQVGITSGVYEEVVIRGMNKRTCQYHPRQRVGLPAIQPHPLTQVVLTEPPF